MCPILRYHYVEEVLELDENCNSPLSQLLDVGAMLVEKADKLNVGLLIFKTMCNRPIITIVCRG